MRYAAAASLILLMSAGAAAAQTADRYGAGTYAAPPAYAPAAQRPERVLSWPGKSTTPPAPPVQQQRYPGYGGQPAYGAQVQPAPYAQDRGAPVAPYAQQRNATLYPPQAYAQGANPQGAYAPPPYAQPQAAYGAPPAPIAYYPYPSPSYGLPNAPAAAPAQPMPQTPMPPAQMQPAPQQAAPAAQMPAYPTQPVQAYPTRPAQQTPVPPVATAPSGVYQGMASPQGLMVLPTFPSASGGAGAVMAPAPPTSIYQSPQVQRQVQSQTAPMAAPVAQPTVPGVTGAAPSTATPEMMAAAMPPPNANARRYSVGRDYGAPPDPVPPSAGASTEPATISSDMFAEAVTLADPPPPTERRTTTTKTDDSKKALAQLNLRGGN